MTRCSFVKCCTTNTLDGTEDNILCVEMDKSDPFADDNRVESTVDEEGKLLYAGEDEWKNTFKCFCIDHSIC